MKLPINAFEVRLDYRCEGEYDSVMLFPNKLSPTLDAFLSDILYRANYSARLTRCSLVKSYEPDCFGSMLF